MPSSTGYPIEEFLEAITAQLDQTQDALRLKAVNRPLTFALKDFNVDLKVFVEMDANGRVTFRPAAPNEEGASTVTIGFTTITRPMIEENTISMEMAQAPGLDELGLDREDARNLAKIGVRNAAQLKNFERSAGEDTLSRHTGVDISRIRGALDLARPRLDMPVADRPVTGQPVATPPAPPRHAQPEPQPQPEPTPRPAPTGPAHPTLDPRPDFVPSPPLAPEITGHLTDRLRDRLRAASQPAPAPAPDPVPTPAPAPRSDRPTLKLPKGARDIRLKGANLIEAGRAPTARLGGRTLPTLAATQSTVTFAIPEDVTRGTLEVELPDGTAQRFDLSRDGEDQP